MSPPEPSRSEAQDSGSTDRIASHSRARPHRIFLIALALTFLNLAAWSLATPLFASPDEPAQVARAAALVRGELIGHTIRNAGDPSTKVTVPVTYSLRPRTVDCFAFHDTVPASCTGVPKASGASVATSTYVGRYPPLYYALVGWPSLLTTSTTGLYLMRLMSALLNAIFLALAIMTVATWSRSRLLLVGVVLAATPMTFFLGGVVNPSGLEITSAICLWCGGLVLVLERASPPPPRLIVVVVVSMATLMLTRGLSPLWVLFIIALLALLAGKQALREVARSRGSRWALIALLPCAALSVSWIVGAHALDLLAVGAPVSNKIAGPVEVAQIFGFSGGWIQQMVGIFGWLDTLSPLVTYLFWYGSVGLVLFLALICGTVRQVTMLVGLIVIVIVVPVIISFGQAHRLGIIWQGRYILPMAVGIPLAGLAIVEQSPAIRWSRTRVASLLCVGAGVAEFAAFATALRRYTVGVSGPINYLHGSWSPPLGSGAITLAYLLALVLYLGFVRSLVSKGPAGTTDDRTARSGGTTEEPRQSAFGRRVAIAEQ